MVVATQETMLSCSECGSTNLIFDRERGETVCTNCGLVASDQAVSTRTPMYHFIPERQKEIHHKPSTQLVHDKGLSTSIIVGRDARGKLLSNERKCQIRRMAKLQVQSRCKIGYERSLAKGLAQLQRFIEQLRLPDSIHVRASIIFRKAEKAQLVRGRSITCLVAASLYTACRQSELPKSYQEIAKVTTVRTKDLTRCYRLLITTLGFSIPNSSATKYLSMFAEQLCIRGKPVSDAIQILKSLGQHAVGKDPRGLAASALYIACQRNREPVTQYNVASVAGVTEVTVRNRYKDMVHFLKLKEID